MNYTFCPVQQNPDEDNISESQYKSPNVEDLWVKSGYPKVTALTHDYSQVSCKVVINNFRCLWYEMKNIYLQERVNWIFDFFEIELNEKLFKDIIYFINQQQCHILTPDPKTVKTLTHRLLNGTNYKRSTITANLNTLFLECIKYIKCM